MEIHGKTLKEIFRKVPPAYKLVIIAGGLFFAYIAVFISMSIVIAILNINSIREVKIANLSSEATNLLDPSLTSDGFDSLLVYSAQLNNFRSVRIAFNADKNCGNWSQIPNQGLEGKNDKLIAPDGISTFREGTWNVETPSVVYDPDDKGHEWKLYAYKYFWSPSDSFEDSIKIAKHYGVVVYKYSSNPKSQWSAEEWIFSPEDNYPPKPYNAMVKTNLNALSPDLKDVTSYSRPSVIYKDGILLMSLSAFTDGDTPNRTILVASEDHGNNWIYIGSPINESDMQYIAKGKKYKGATLMLNHNVIYLAAVVGDVLTDEKTIIIPFADAGKALLERNGKGKPEIENKFSHFYRDDDVLSGGFATYSDYCKSTGIIVSEQAKKDNTYKLIKTGKSPTD